MERFTPRRIWSPSARSGAVARDIELAGELEADPAVEPALGGVRSCCWLFSWLLISTAAIAAGTVMPNCKWTNLAVCSIRHDEILLARDDDEFELVHLETDAVRLVLGDSLDPVCDRLHGIGSVYGKDVPRMPYGYGQLLSRTFARVIPHVWKVARQEQDAHEIRVLVRVGVLALVEDEQPLDAASL